MLAKGAMEPGHAVAVLRECCRASLEAREPGIVTPRNVFLGSARLSLVERIVPLRRGDVSAEDFAYLSPALANGATEITASDVVFSLGAIFAEMLSGVALFRRANDYETILAVRRPIGLRFPDAPLHLRAVLSRALATAPTERYASAAELAAAVDEANAKPSPYR